MKLVSVVVVFVVVDDAPSVCMELHRFLMAELPVLVLLEALEVLGVLRVEYLRMIQLLALDCREVGLHLDVPALEGVCRTECLL